MEEEEERYARQGTLEIPKSTLVLERDDPFIDRAIARVLDLTLVVTLALILVSILLLTGHGLPLWGYVSLLVKLWYGYGVLWEAITATTPGKWLVGIQVEDEIGGEPGFAASLVRNAWILPFIVPHAAGWILGALASLAIPITILRHKEGRGLHDRAARTRITHLGDEGEAAQE